MSLKKNVIANYVGQGLTGLLGILFVPQYIKYLGVEAYGLIGVFLALQTWMVILDLGMTPMLSREMARLTSGAQTPHAIRDLLRSISILYFLQIAMLLIIAWLVVPWIGEHWFSPDQLQPDTIASALFIMALVAALRGYSGLFRGALQGLQQQVWLNGWLTLTAIVRYGGAVPILIWVSPTIIAFFFWQLAVSLIECAALRLKVLHLLPARDYQGRFSTRSLRSIWRFAAGTLLTSILVLALTQLDKLLLTRMLPLEDFGRYTLASTVAAALTLFFSPVSTAIYPRFTELFEQQRVHDLARAYHHSAQLVTVLAAPAVLLVVIWSREILTMWTGDAALAGSVAPILSLLALGTLLNGFMNIPHMLQLAAGWPSFAARMNVIALIFMGPTVFFLISWKGATGAASAWVLLNFGYIVFAVPFMHKRLLPEAKWNWYFKDLLLPFGAAAASLLATIPMYPDQGSALQIVMFMVFALTLSYVAAYTAASELRIEPVASLWRRLFDR